MTISHHLDDATVVALAAGTLPGALAVVAASHASTCPACRSAVRVAEGIGGGLLMYQPETAVSDLCRAATLASLDGAGHGARSEMSAVASDLPRPLARLLKTSNLEEISWKMKGPGIFVHDVPMAARADGKLMMLKIAAGRSIPEHGHGGEELTLVLKGAYSDKFGRFGAGDIADLDEESEHTPVTDPVEGCICVIAIESQTKFKSFWARLAQPFVGI